MSWGGFVEREKAEGMRVYGGWRKATAPQELKLLVVIYFSLYFVFMYNQIYVYHAIYGVYCIRDTIHMYIVYIFIFERFHNTFIQHTVN